MNDFLTILDNHRELLRERGYDEIGLGSPDEQGELLSERGDDEIGLGSPPEEPGLFMKRLESFFLECIRRAKYEKEIQSFFIEAFGFFDDEKDMIAFRFHYEFDPVNKSIDLKSFSASMDGIKRTFLIGPNMYHLIHAAKVHKILSNERQIQNSGELTIPQPDIDKMVNEQDQYLKQIGYYKTMFTGDPSELVRRELKSILEKMAGQQAVEIQSIEINRYLHFYRYDSMKCSFHYLYDPVKSNLHLESITAKTIDAEETFLMAKGKPSVTLQQIYKAVRDAERIEKAKKISRHIPGVTKKPKL